MGRNQSFSALRPEYGSFRYLGYPKRVTLQQRF